MANTQSRKKLYKERIPVSGHRDILTVRGKDDGYVYRWVNDVDDRLARFQAGGYEFVDDDVEVGTRSADSSKGTSTIKSKNVGRGVTAYLMRIEKELYEEDQKEKQRLVDRSEADTKRALNSGQNGTYGKVDIN